MVRVSQREMARRAQVAASTVARIESGDLVPSLEVLRRILDVAGLRLVVIDAEGRLVEPMEDIFGIHDSRGRRYPSHLDLILDPKRGEWWGDRYGLVRPPETFRMDPVVRQAQRRYSQWVARPKRYQNQPPPASPEWILRLRSLGMGRRDPPGDDGG